MILNFIGQRVINQCDFTFKDGYNYITDHDSIPKDFVRDYEEAKNVLKSQTLFIALLIGSVAFSLFLLFGTTVSTAVLIPCGVSGVFAARKISQNTNQFSDLIKAMSKNYQILLQLYWHNNPREKKELIDNKFKKIETFKILATNKGLQHREALAKLSAIKV